MLAGLTAFVLAIVIGTFVEYWGHRFMHKWLLRKRHARHHQSGVGQGWLGEFFDYSTGTLLLMWLGFLHSVEAGIGFAAGGVAYAAWAAYSHQLQHERPELCFWLRRPVHYLHHHHHMWHHNFGISVSLWDHVFRTYKKVDWQPPAADRKPALLSYLRIKWIGWGGK
jgi:sterol desaturase/sphingolipid hydroxylase (fatty acid hydroxylase superfamily)